MSQTNKKANSRKTQKKPTSRSSKKKVAKTDESAEIGHSTEDTNIYVKSFTWKHGVVFTLLFIVILIGGFAYNVFKLTTQNIFDQDSETPLIEQLGLIIGSDDKPLNGEEDDRINVLLLGIGGEKHDGGTLTDSMMVASYQPSTQQVSLISLPRDLIVKYYDDQNPRLWEGRKLNLAYQLGGIDLSTEKVSEVTGLELHYYVVIDFSGFTKMIDDVGGIDVEIDNSFTGLYGSKELSIPCPITQTYNLEDGAYCAIPFQRGVENMDGERSLIFSRVRKLAPGSLNPEEGTDFARAQRQQIILESFQDKVFSSETLIRPDRITNVLENLGSHIDTNMELWEIAKFLRFTSDINSDQIISKVVDQSANGLVYSTIAEQTGASVVVPRAGDYNYTEIHRLADTVFEVAETIEEEATVQVLNGTTRNGLAARTAELLDTLDIEVIDINNAPEAGETTTRIYDLTDDEKSSSLDLIGETIGGAKTATNREWKQLQEIDSKGIIDESVDFIIILGEDSIDDLITL